MHARVRKIVRELREAARDLRPLDFAAAVCTATAAGLAHRAGLPREFFVECADEAYRMIEGTLQKGEGGR